MCEAAARGGGGGGAQPDAGAGPFCTYLRHVAFADARPHLLLQPFLPQLAHHFEVKIYFLRRAPFLAALSYGKEKLVAQVIRPSTHASLFSYFAPLVAESQRVLAALPSDGAHDPKVLLRVDWGCCTPTAGAEASRVRAAAADDGGEEEVQLLTLSLAPAQP